jgi:flagellar export protein FliJ
MSRRKFQFRLEPIRGLRRDAEQSVMKELAGELTVAEDLRSQLAGTEARLRAAQAPPQGALTAHELAARQHFVERLERERTEAHIRLRRQEAHVDQARLRLTEATKKRRMLDHVEGRRRAVHDAEALRVENDERQELALLSHMRSQGAA